MRRSFLAGIGVAAVLVFAACSPDQPATRAPLAPTEPSFAKSDQCKNTLANAIEAKHDQLFTEADEVTLNSSFDVVQSECSTSSSIASANVLAYLQLVVTLRESLGAVDATRAAELVGLWNDVTLYATGAAINRPYTVLMPGEVPVSPDTEYVRGGGAAVLDPAGGPDSMYTFDGQAGVHITPVTQTPSGPRLWTLDPAGCPPTSLEPATTDCYDIQVYPPVTVAWNPGVSIGMCVRHTDDEAAITHTQADYGTEVLTDSGTFSFPWDPGHSCTQTHSPVITWLERKGPLGRALAKGVNLLRPQPLLADDAGESGLGLFTSPFGAALTVIFEETFDAPGNALGPFPQDPNEVAPDIGDSWDVFAPSPGSAQIVDGDVLAPGGGLPGQVIALSQAQGACTKKCPTYRLLGTRVNPPSANAIEIGTYEATWKSLQNKPNIKEAPFVLLSASGAEIARLSYVSESNQNRIKYNGTVVGTWTQNVAQSFKIIVRLKDDATTTTDYRTILYINGNVVQRTPTSTEWEFKTSNQTTFNTLGYRLDGIDAGIMAADNIVVRRLPDKP